MGPVGCPETSVTTNLRCVTSQKSEDHIYTAKEAWNHERDVTFCALFRKRHSYRLNDFFSGRHAKNESDLFV